MQSDFRKGFAITAAGVLIISPDTLLFRLIDADQWTILFWRCLLTGVAILVCTAITKRSAFLDELLSQGRGGLLLVACFSVGTIGFVLSVANTSVANCLFIVSTSPLFSAIISRIFLGERIGRATMVAIAIALCGIALMVTESMGRGTTSLFGDAAALVSAIMLAATFCIARANKHLSMVPAVGLSGLATAAVASMVAASLHVPADSIPPLAAMGLLVVPLGFGLMTLGPRYISAPLVSLLLLGEAVIGPLLIWFILGEDPGSLAWIGGIIVLCALALPALLQLKRRPEPLGDAV